MSIGFGLQKRSLRVEFYPILSLCLKSPTVGPDMAVDLFRYIDKLDGESQIKRIFLQKLSNPKVQ